jgi:glutamyl-tRNA synthetase
MRADGRFAPSPTGPLHLGSLRTALAAWLFARSESARFHMRVEDLDPQRSRSEFARHQLDDLRALSLDWDGTVLRQSERGPEYAAALRQLEHQSRLYPCFCTRAEIREAASAPHGDLPEGAYPGTCRRLTRAERAQRMSAGQRFALRVHAADERVSYNDRLLGPVTAMVDDFVVRRADGVTAYQLAVVVDDAAQGIGEVVRGADLAGSTPRQILLARLLGLAVPAYAHVGLVVGPDGRRLAKRHRGSTLAERPEPRAVTLARLAHSLGLARDRERVASPSELIAEFDPVQLPREPVMIA